MGTVLQTCASKHFNSSNPENTELCSIQYGSRSTYEQEKGATTQPSVHFIHVHIVCPVSWYKQSYTSTIIYKELLALARC